jgi:hypothetical protein
MFVIGYEPSHLNETVVVLESRSVLDTFEVTPLVIIHD